MSVLESSNEEVVVLRKSIDLKSDKVRAIMDKGRAVPGDLLFDLEIEEVPMLLQSIFPKVGLVGLVGSSDTGKSTFLHQFSMAISGNEREFLGYKLDTKHRRVLYVTTEDDHYATSSLIRKQSGQRRSLIANIKFLFDSYKIIERLSRELDETPVDCVIIDAYSDVFGGDMNQANIVRGFLNQFQNLANKYECLFVFLHHTGKSKQNLPPSKDNVLGSQAFEAKMRTLIEFRADPKKQELRHLCIVKGNYVKAEDKSKSIMLYFGEDLNFRNTGIRVAFDKLGTQESKTKIHNTEIIEEVKRLSSEGNSVRRIEEILSKKDIDIGKSTIALMVKKKENLDETDLDVQDTYDDETMETIQNNPFDWFDTFMNI